MTLANAHREVEFQLNLCGGIISYHRLSTQLCEKKGFFKRFDFQKKKVFATKKKVFRAKWIAF